jgi:hypothetical protein
VRYCARIVQRIGVAAIFVDSAFGAPIVERFADFGLR